MGRTPCSTGSSASQWCQLQGTRLAISFFRSHWYEVGAVVALGTVVWLILAWQDVGVLRRLLLLNFVALLVHQYKEYGWPGGEPAVMNIVIQRSPTPDRYPLNQNSAMAIKGQRASILSATHVLRKTAPQAGSLARRPPAAARPGQLTVLDPRHHTRRWGRTTARASARPDA
jgi:hypothetical protein